QSLRMAAWKAACFAVSGLSNADEAETAGAARLWPAAPTSRINEARSITNRDDLIRRLIITSFYCSCPGFNPSGRRSPPESCPRPKGWLKVYAFPKRKLQHVITARSFEPALQRLQVFDEIVFLLLSQVQFLEAVVVVDHIEQSREAPVVVEPALHVRE